MQIWWKELTAEPVARPWDYALPKSTAEAEYMEQLRTPQAMAGYLGFRADYLKVNLPTSVSNDTIAPDGTSEAISPEAMPDELSVEDLWKATEAALKEAQRFKAITVKTQVFLRDFPPLHPFCRKRDNEGWTNEEHRADFEAFRAECIVDKEHAKTMSPADQKSRQNRIDASSARGLAHFKEWKAALSPEELLKLKKKAGTFLEESKDFNI